MPAARDVSHDGFMTAAPTLAQLVRAPAILVAPGVYDALGALLVQQAGFSAAYVSGAGIAYSRFGRPDIGLVSMSEVAACVSAISERVELPLLHELLYEEPTAAGGDVPVDRANVVAWLILPHVGELKTASLEDRVVLPGEE